MQTELIRELNNVLRLFPQFWSGEELNRTIVIDAINRKQPEIIKALVANEKIKSVYGTEIDDVFIFDFDKLGSLLKYKEYWANSFTKYRNKLGLTSGGKYLDYSSDVVLDFPFKDCVLEGGMTKEDQGKDEVYYNEIIARDEIDRLFSPKLLKNAKRYTKDNIEENITEFDDEDNLIIKGNNLIALHSIKSRYAGKIKLIYIDPPYNTGTDSFKYNDKFNHSTWLLFMKNRLEVAKEMLSDDGVIFVQCDDNEQAYLKVLMDSLFGTENNEITIYVQVRFGNKTLNEDNNYQKLMEHIFVYSNGNFKPNKDKVPYNNDSFCYEINELTHGETEIIGGKEVVIFKPGQYEIKKVEPHNKALKATWATGSLVNQGGSAAEFLHLHLKERKEKDGLGILYKVIGMGTRGDGLGYRYITGPKKESAVNGLFYTGMPIDKNVDTQEKEIPINNIFYDNDIYSDNFWDFKDNFGNCRTQGGVKLNAGKKPEQLLKRIIEISTKENDFVMDFHLGSGTTCAVAHKMKRHYIGIEQIDYNENSAWNRIQNVISGESSGISKEVNWQGGGSFVYAELMELNAYFVHQILKAQSNDELEKLFALMKTEAHLNYQVALENVLSAEYEVDGVFHKVAFSELELHEQKQLLIEILDKNQLYVDASDMDDYDLRISDSDKAFTRSFYSKD